MDSENTNVSLLIEGDLLEKVDKRAKDLDLNRSQYFRRLARADLDQAGQIRPGKGREQKKAA